MYLLVFYVMFSCVVFCIHRSWLEHGFKCTSIIVHCMYAILRKHDDNNSFLLCTSVLILMMI